MFKKVFLILFYLILFLVVFLLPRLLSYLLGGANPWSSFLYLYVLGGIVFVLGLHTIIRSKACDFNIPKDKFWFINTILGFIFFFTFHGFWIFISLKSYAN